MMFQKAQNYHKKYHCKMTLLSSVHIGTGKEEEGSLLEKNGEEHALLDIDAYIEKETKHLQGKELESRINEITSNIEFESFSTDNFPILRKAGIKGGGQINSFREHIHIKRKSGQTLYIPGSSLKGSMQTALLRSFLRDLRPPYQEARNEYHFRKAYDRQLLNLSGGIQGSFYRFLQIPDIEFKNISGQIQKSIGANWTGDSWKYTGGRGNKPLDIWLECIPKGAEANFTMTIPQGIFKLDNIERIRDLQTAVSKKNLLLDQKRLFSVMREHTLRLVTQEIDDLDAAGGKNKASFYEEGDPKISQYFDNLLDVEDEIKDLKENEVIIRLGYGSGWRFMTGNWQEDRLPGRYEWQNLKRAVRGPRYDRIEYFPKSRRMSDAGVPLGFVKIEIV